MAKIEVRCPICSEWDKIEIPDENIKKVNKVLISINVTSGMICEHSFFVYIDKNLITRDCFIADIKIEVPKISTVKETEEQTTLETDAIKTNLIKLNLSETLMSYVFRSIFFGKKVLIISDQLFLYDHISNFFNYIFQNSFKFNMVVISDEDYKKNKKDYKEYLIFRKREVLRDNEAIIIPKKLEIEKSIVQKFLTEYDSNSSLIILRDEIKKVYDFSETVARFVEDFKEQPITTKRISDQIKEKHHEKIKTSYLKFLIKIVDNYFKVKIPKIKRVSNLLQQV